MFLFRPNHQNIPSSSQIGGKGVGLARLECLVSSKTDWRVPPWFAITTDAFRTVMTDKLVGKSPSECASIIRSISIPGALREEVEREFERLETNSVAVRSSAVSEDGAHASFAGQLESRLFVTRDLLWEAIREVWISGFSDRALEYARRHRAEPDAVAVIVQCMIDAEIAGVSFAIDPVNGNRKAVTISSVYGLGEGLVSGELDADTYTEVSGIIEARIVEKVYAIRAAPNGGTRTENVRTELRNTSSLSDAQVISISSATRAISRTIGSPQDIEWAIDATGQCYLLQARPITGLEHLPDMTQTRTVFDNSNITESFPGITLPLTFSFVRDVYSEVYRQFVRVMGVHERDIANQPETFRMLGYFKGRIYYNLLSWHGVVAMLPFYNVNAGFMEQMMGVKERLATPAPPKSRARSLARMPRLIFDLLRRYRGIARDLERFHTQLDAMLAPYESRDMTADSSHELAGHYRALEHGLLRNWTTPIVNDFFVMIFYGLLKALTKKWISSEPGLENDLLSGEGGLISAEPGKRMAGLAEAIRRVDGLADELDTLAPSEIVARLHQEETVLPLLTMYLQRFGNRWMEELKLETITPSEEPALLGEIIQGTLREQPRSNKSDIRVTAEAKMRAALKRSFFRRRLYRYVLRVARERVKGRENLRFERTRAFAVVRNIFLSIGLEFAREGILDEARDIFFLTKEEVFSFIEGTAVTIDLRSLVNSRKSAFALYALEHVPDRFETYGIASFGNEFKSMTTTEPAGDILAGLGCSAGSVRGIARLVRNPKSPGDLRGTIMIAERTDPGWAPLFSLVRGIAVERGSLLSHSAIVARELGIPCVVGIPGLMNLLHDGEPIEIDGRAGTVRKCEDS